MCCLGLVRAGLDFQEVVAELGLDGAVNNADVAGENHGIKFGNHLALSERAQVAALFSRGTKGVRCGEVGEIVTGCDLLF